MKITPEQIQVLTAMIGSSRGSGGQQIAQSGGGVMPDTYQWMRSRLDDLYRKDASRAEGTSKSRGSFSDLPDLYDQAGGQLEVMDILRWLSDNKYPYPPARGMAGGWSQQTMTPDQFGDGSLNARRSHPFGPR